MRGGHKARSLATWWVGDRRGIVSGYHDDQDDIDDDPVGDYDDMHDDIIIDDYDEMDDDDDEEEEDDDYEDATPDEIDFVIAAYREDGAPVVIPLAKPLANDLEDLIEQLRRLPGDAGSVGFVSISGEFFVIVRVRGRNVQVLLNDSVAATDWPIARDVADYLNLDVNEDDESEPIGDLDVLADQGLSELDMEAIATDLDEDSDELVRQIARHLGLERQFDEAVTEE
ncbi:MAG: tRNA adenosine deaminase-associated protein [Propionibacteriaceae bacterium]|nr:tRNA adenosine deaminase-associated protein [Propionibacteriaceae bacterium]